MSTAEVRIITKRAFEFMTNESRDKAQKVRTEPFIVASVPEWVVQSDLFRLAQKDGTAEIVGSATLDMSMGELEELRAQAEELGIENYKRMKPDTLRKKIADAQTAENQSGEDQAEPPAENPAS